MFKYYFSIDTDHGNQVESYMASNMEEALDKLSANYKEEITILSMYRE